MTKDYNTIIKDVRPERQQFKVYGGNIPEDVDVDREQWYTITLKGDADLIYDLKKQIKNIDTLDIKVTNYEMDNGKLKIKIDENNPFNIKYKIDETKKYLKDEDERITQFCRTWTIKYRHLQSGDLVTISRDQVDLINYFKNNGNFEKV